MMVVKGDRDHTRDCGPSARARQSACQPAADAVTGLSTSSPPLRALHLLSSAAAVTAALISPASLAFVRRRRRLLRPDRANAATAPPAAVLHWQ